MGDGGPVMPGTGLAGGMGGCGLRGPVCPEAALPVLGVLSALDVFPGGAGCCLPRWPGGTPWVLWVGGGWQVGGWQVEGWQVRGWGTSDCFLSAEPRPTCMCVCVCVCGSRAWVCVDLGLH